MLQTSKTVSTLQHNLQFEINQMDPERSTASLDRDGLKRIKIANSETFRELPPEYRSGTSRIQQCWETWGTFGVGVEDHLKHRGWSGESWRAGTAVGRQKLL